MSYRKLLNMNTQKVNQMEITNPMIWADVPDPDVIRVGSYYYMVSTTMHLCPGAPIMRSEDLVNWDIVSYVYDQLEDDDRHNLIESNYYGKGSWAACIRHHQGIFYVSFCCNETGKTYIYKTDNIEQGSWIRTEMPYMFYDASIFFEDGRVYIIHGNGEIKITELKEDLSGIKEDGINQVIINAVSKENRLNAEGNHFYKINNYYYLFVIDWPKADNKGRLEWCYRSDSLLGEYERRLVFDDNFGYYNNGVAQGGIVDTMDGDWYAILFQDHGAVGRIPMLLPVSWKDSWPLLGVAGKVPLRCEIATKKYQDNIIIQDEFDYTENKLSFAWQWNHNPEPSLWSVIERSSFLRLKTGNVVRNLLFARNTVSQRTAGPVFVAETKLDSNGMKPGDYAGIAAFQNLYGMVGIKVSENGKKHIIVAMNCGNGDPMEEYTIECKQDVVYLKITFLFNTGGVDNLTEIDQAYFSYSYDGILWEDTDCSLQMKYTLDHFMGYRIALYNYATIKAGGYADFDYLHYDNYYLLQ